MDKLTNAEKSRRRPMETKLRNKAAMDGVRNIFIGHGEMTMYRTTLLHSAYKLFQKRIAFGIQEGFIIKDGKLENETLRFDDGLYQNWQGG